jgi:hypothetical protein
MDLLAVADSRGLIDGRGDQRMAEDDLVAV